MTETETPEIVDKALLVRVTTDVWRAPYLPDLAPILKVKQVIQEHFESHTLAWDGNYRLLPRRMYEPFFQKYDELARQFDAAIDTFAKETYPVTYDKAQFRDGEAFNPKDYPPPSKMHLYFFVDIDFSMVPHWKIFGLLFPEGFEDAGDIMAVHIETATRAAIQEPYERLLSQLEPFRAALEDSTSQRLRTSMIQRLTELTSVLPYLDLLDDGKLEQACKILGALLNGMSREEFKRDAVRRTAMIEAIDKILPRLHKRIKKYK